MGEGVSVPRGSSPIHRHYGGRGSGSCFFYIKFVTFVVDYWILEDKSSRYLYQLFFLVPYLQLSVLFTFLHGIIVSVMKATMKNVISQFIGHEVQVI